MRYAKLLQHGDTIGVCAPSSGVREDLHLQLDNAHANVRALGYKTIETESVRIGFKCVSTDAQTRAEEFMNLYENPAVAGIMPPWGGEFLMDMLPYLDFSNIRVLTPKWVCGYSDITTLSFPLTVCCDMATVHGANFMNMGFESIHASDLMAFDVMEKAETTQHNSEYWGQFITSGDPPKKGYEFTEKTVWKSLDEKNRHAFKGRMIGGCLDVLCKLLGTRFAPVPDFLEKYKNDGFIWTLESCEMKAADIYRSLWQMRECGWFKYCTGVLFGRPTGYSDSRDFTLTDALKKGFGNINIPVIYDADIGHVPPQIQIINGAYGTVNYSEGRVAIKQNQV
jgi:muramoyltetrapeptide carboxypeptidase LdcA involved in peptidoglycan recycling